MNPRDLAGNTQEEEEGEPQKSSWKHRRRRMVNPRDLAGNAEEEGEPQR